MPLVRDMPYQPLQDGYKLNHTVSQLSPIPVDKFVHNFVDSVAKTLWFHAYNRLTKNESKP